VCQKETEKGNIKNLSRLKTPRDSLLDHFLQKQGSNEAPQASSGSLGHSLFWNESILTTSQCFQFDITI